MNPAFTFKRGDTFQLLWPYTPGTDGPSTLAGVTVTGAIKTKLGTVYPLTVTMAGDNLSFTTVAAGTDNYELGGCRVDVKLLFSGGVIAHSATLCGEVLDRVTP